MLEAPKPLLAYAKANQQAEGTSVDKAFSYKLMALAQSYFNFKAPDNLVTMFWYVLVSERKIPIPDILHAIDQCMDVSPQWMPNPGQLAQLAEAKWDTEHLRAALKVFPSGIARSFESISPYVEAEKKKDRVAEQEDEFKRSRLLESTDESDKEMAQMRERSPALYAQVVICKQLPTENERCLCIAQAVQTTVVGIKGIRYDTPGVAREQRTQAARDESYKEFLSMRETPEQFAKALKSL